MSDVETMCALGLAIANHQSTNMNVLQLVLSIGVFATGINAEATAPAGACLICGPGKVVTNPAGIFEFPGQPSMTCAELNWFGYVAWVWYFSLRYYTR